MNYTTYTVKEFILYILRKWWAIVLAVVLLAAVLGGPKLMRTKVESGATIIASEIISVENNAKIVDQNNIQRYEDYSDMWMRDTSLSVFFQQASEQFDMKTLCDGWNAENLTDQIEWFKDHVICKTITNTPKYEFHFTLPATASTYTYVHENAQAFLDAFVEYSVGLSGKEVADVDYQVLNSSYREIPADSDTSAVKYLLIGGVIGGILAVFVLAILFLASRKIVSKNMLLSSFDVDSIDGAKQLDYDVFCYLIGRAEKSEKKAFVLSSSLGDLRLAQALQAQFKKYGYSLVVANISSQKLDGLSDKVEKADCDVLASPGKCGEMIAKLTADGRYLLIVADMPADNAVVSELIDQSACAVFVEKIYASNKKMVERSIQAAYHTATKSPVCIAWEK